MKLLDLTIVIALVAAPLSALGHSNNTHGNNPWVNVAGVEFEAGEDLTDFMLSAGLIEPVMSNECGNTWSQCEDDTFGPWQSELQYCIDIYLCAYYMCDECSDSARIVCIADAQWDLYNCSGIDLMSFQNDVGLEHDDALAVLLELYD